MKKTILVVLVCLAMVLMASCTTSTGTTVTTTASSGNGSSSGNESAGSSTSGSSSSSSTDTSSTTTTGTTDLTDTSGNTVSSGTATVSFQYGSQTTSKTLSAAYLIDGVSVEITSGTYASASDSSDQVVFLVVNGGSLTITGTESSPVTITKSGSGASGGQVGDDYNFYGINSGIVVAGSSSTATISYADITTSANGANAVVATNSGTVTISDSSIVSTGSAGARGLHATYGGVINASDTEITTSGSSCASIATDRGGGTITATGMTLETNSAGSPLVYSTGSITVKNSTGSANKAQMVVVEGGSSATLTGCTFTCSGDGNRTGTSESNSASHTIDAGGIFIYQSMSGDSEDGTDYFTATDCSLTVTTSGVPMFYITNITAVIALDGNTFTQASSSDYLFICEETNQWGSTGSNGGKATVSLTDQSLSGYKAFVGTSSSSLTITATDSSSTSITKTTGTW